MKFLSYYNKFVKEAIGYVNHADYQREMEIFRTNNKYDDWSMLVGKVELKDNPYYLLFQKNEFEDGDKVIFFCEKEREGRLEKRTDGTYCIRDLQKNMWGVGGILQSPDGWIVKKPNEY